MTKPSQRALEELYNVTQPLSQPKITPVLRGSYTMQGPVDEADSDFQTNMVHSQTNLYSRRSSKSRKVDTGVKSGSCNVCSAPCSSCLHINQFTMGSRINDSSVEAFVVKAGADKANRCMARQPSEVSNVVGVNSSSDSLSENADSKQCLKTFDVSAGLEEAVMPSIFDSQKGEGLDDSVSCVTGNTEANKMITSGVKNEDRTSLPCSSASGHSPMIVSHDVEDVPAKSSRESKVSEEVAPGGVPSQDLELINLSSKDLGSDSLKMRDSLLETSRGKSPPNNHELKNFEEDTSAPSREEKLEGSSNDLKSSSVKEAVHNLVCGNALDTANNSVQKNDDMEVDPADESDDSDLVEHDVKVCDICGDAGREDLLAICCRCSDGAEHTYCMRDMLDKVPEDNWLCEECKFDEQMKTERDDRIGKVDGNDKNNYSDHASTENVNSSDIEGSRTKDRLNVKILGKRHRDDAEVSSTVKKPALDSAMASPKASVSNKIASLSRENSLRISDRGRVQPTHSVNDTLESARSAPTPRVQTARGTFLKSNSFSSQPKVKLVDQAVLPKQKPCRESASLRPKDGAARSIGKSMSFKSSNAGHSNALESVKPKMLSPRLSRIHESKQLTERSLERKSSFKSEQTSMNSMMGKSTLSVSKLENKQASHVERGSLIATGNNETKAACLDNKIATLSKSSSLLARRSLDSPVSLGESKKLLSNVNCISGVPSSTGASNLEQKTNQGSTKEESASSCGIAERPYNTNEVQDGSSQLRESAISGERVKEFSGNRSRLGSSNGGRTVSCQKCKETGHSTQFCTADGPALSAVAPLSMKCSRDESGNLKAATEAAVLRKPGLSRKHRFWEKSDDPSMSSETASVDQLSITVSKRNLTCTTELREKHAVSRNSFAEPLKPESSNNVKQSSLLAETLSTRVGDAAPIIASDEKSSARDTPSHVPPAMSIFHTSLAFPEHEYVWQGTFEIHKGGKSVELWDGMQAHLSTCASPKVLDAVNNKLSRRIALNEVPRLSTWPVQFQECGVREDNIALFFFAKDLERFYRRSYKILLDNMMKNDLALKGNLGGVELLIFPSNQLPEHAQRWNMLFFLWGVFRGKKENSLQHVPEDLHSCKAVVPPPKDLTSEEQHGLLSEKANVNADRKVSSLDELHGRLDSGSIGAVQTGSVQETGNLGRCLEGHVDSGCRPETGFQAGIGGTDGSRGERMVMQLDSFDNSSAATHKMTSEGGDKVVKSHKLPSSRDQSEVGIDLRYTYADEETSLDTNNECDGWQLNGRRHQQAESSVDNEPQVIYACTSQVMHTNDAQNSVLNGVHGMASVSPIPEKRCDENATPDFIGKERYFFPVDPVKETGVVGKSLPWKVDEAEQDQLKDGVPNLDLALGAERKPLVPGIPSFLVGKVDKKVREEQHGDMMKEEEASASLSLSLSFPFPDNQEQMIKSVSSNQQRQVNPAMLLFGDVKEK